MLQHGKALATWQLTQPPIRLACGQSLPARRLPDHRTAYLAYEGPVSGNRGHVTSLDRGEYQLLDDSETRWEFSLAGQALRGRFELLRLATPSPDGSDWLFRRLAD